MLAIALALAAASSWGFSAVLVRLGLRDMSTSMGTLISLVAGLLLTGVLAVATQSEALSQVTLTTVGLFAIIGILNFPMGRFFNYLSMSRLGVARSTPLLASAPLFAVILAVLLTGEDLRLATGVGIALIFTGLYVTLTGRTA
ncbi:MAG: DMT family transporter [Dehalococcoidia bacterium]